MLASLPPGSAQCCVTSPPCFNLRDYRVAAQIGMKASPEAYVAELVGVFREVRRVLAEDGVLWVNIGDSNAEGRLRAQLCVKSGRQAQHRRWHVSDHDLHDSAIVVDDLVAQHELGPHAFHDGFGTIWLQSHT